MSSGGTAPAPLGLPGFRRSSNAQLLHNLVLFGRLLRRLGLDIGPEQLAVMTEAAHALGLESRRDFKAAVRAICVTRREQIGIFDRAFDLFWTADAFRPRQGLDLGSLLRRLRRPRPQTLVLPAAGGDEPGGSPPGDESPVLEKRQSYTAAEVLRTKDFSALDAAERAAVDQLMRRHPWEVDPRRTRRRVPAARGRDLDLRRTLRRSLRHGGEVLSLARRQKRLAPRPVVVLCDISGSMEAYARIFLQFVFSLKAATHRLEAFVFATRLTRITRQLEQRDVDQALRLAAAAVVDWGGGTRIGESFKRFNYDWGRRVLGRGAVVVVLSDCWDRGDVELLERETMRLRRSCDRLVWLNPLLGSPGYQPLTRGIRKILPLIDDFLPVHNLESLEQLSRVLRRASRSTASSSRRR